MTTALHELRELERQNTVKQAPDVVLDTLEPMKNPVSSEPGSPLHTIMIRDPDAAMRRSSSSTSEMMTTFKPALSARMAGAQLRPPPMRPVRPPPPQHRFCAACLARPLNSNCPAVRLSVLSSRMFLPLTQLIVLDLADNALETPCLACPEQPCQV